MRNFMLVAVLICSGIVPPGFAQAPDEGQLIQVLNSNASVVAKETAARRLKQIGTSRCVAAVARLLPDEQLNQIACDVLETLPGDEAGRALQQALARTTGKSQATIIHALGERRHRPALPELRAALNAADELIATSAARAMGRIGGTDAVVALEYRLSTAADALRTALAEALLDCAGQFLMADNRRAAEAIYQRFNQASETEPIRVAAYSGLLKTADPGRALELGVAALKGNDAARQEAALQWAATSADPNATTAFTNLLATATPPLQIALLRLLQLRGDLAAAPVVKTFAQHSDAGVRGAAIAALGTLGDASAVELLTAAATATNTAQQKAARLALVELRRGNVAETMIRQLPAAPSGVQGELIRALTARMDRDSTPQLIELARTGTPVARRAALRGLEQLADATHLPDLVTLLEAAPDESAHAEVQGVIEALADRLPPGTVVDVSALVQGLNTTNLAVRTALLQVGAFFADPQLREAFRAALRDTDPQVRFAAERAVCASRDVKLMPDLLALAKGSTEPGLQVLALEGYVRLVGENDDNFPLARRVTLLKSAYEIARRPEEKRRVLAALGAAPNLESLHAVEGIRNDATVRPEAEVTLVRQAKVLLTTEPTAALRVLRSLAATGGSSAVQSGARAMLKQFDSGWLYAGPYGPKGMEARALFDLEFEPELGQVVEWRRAPGTADLTRPGEVDLLSVANRTHAVMYLKTRVFVPAAQEVWLEIGSDDGLKLWLNGALVHATNATRTLTPAQERLKVGLRAGWNPMLAKVTQATGGWSLMVNFKNADGGEIPELRFDPREPNPAPGFRRQQLATEFLAEGAACGDFNRDGKVDVVAGPYWFAGPDYQQQHEYRPAKTFDPKDYSDNFLTYTADFNGDGWTDVLCVPYPGKEGFWYENPRGQSSAWARHLAYGMIGNESPVWTDVNGDGQSDLVFNNEGFLGYATFNPATPNEPWTFRLFPPKTAGFTASPTVSAPATSTAMVEPIWWKRRVGGSNRRIRTQRHRGSFIRNALPKPPRKCWSRMWMGTVGRM
jgi:HEAT repeat protein